MNRYVKMSVANNAVVSIELQVKSISDSINFYTNVLNMKAEDSSSDQKCKMYVQSSKQEKDFPVVNLQASASKYQTGDVCNIYIFANKIILRY